MGLSLRNDELKKLIMDVTILVHITALYEERCERRVVHIKGVFFKLTKDVTMAQCIACLAYGPRGYGFDFR